MAKPKPRASTSRLEPGQDSIDRSAPYEFRGGWAVAWRVRLYSGEIVTMRSQGATKGQARAKARAKAAQLLATPGTGKWKPTSPVADYMAEVTLPKIETERLADSTSRRYKLAYDLLMGKCSQPHRHQHPIAGLSIHDAMRPRNLTACLEEIAQLHGAVNAKHAKTVAKLYLAAPLKVDELIEYNPLHDLHVDTHNAKKPEYARGGKALALDEYKRVIDYLLNADPNDVEAPRRGPSKREHRVAEAAAIYDIILAQASTGLRTSELCNRPARDCHIDANGVFIVNLPPESTKTRNGRPVPVLLPEVGERLATRLEGLRPVDPLFGAPMDPTKFWDPRNRDRKIARIYEQMAFKLNVPVLLKERGHIWRTTVNTLLHDRLPEDARIRILGHTREVNRQFYTSVIDTKSVIEAASILSVR